ncbi:MAG: hypothetical protein AAFW70_19410 [Cyanobacteria bacterium J06635_10]
MSGRFRSIFSFTGKSNLFLHGQKFRLPSGKIIDGLAHGNLSLGAAISNSLKYSKPKTEIVEESGIGDGYVASSE